VASTFVIAIQNSISMRPYERLGEAAKVPMLRLAVAVLGARTIPDLRERMRLIQNVTGHPLESWNSLLNIGSGKRTKRFHPGVLKRSCDSALRQSVRPDASADMTLRASSAYSSRGAPSSKSPSMSSDLRTSLTAETEIINASTSDTR
jgi:hypothetical protein